MTKAIVIKIGTSTLVGRERGEPVNAGLVNKLAKTICDLEIKLKRKCILVSSGAMGLGITKLGLEKEHSVYDDKLDFKAAITAIGQVQLINVYDEAFLKQGNKHVGQILITDYALGQAGRQRRIKASIKNLFDLNVLPIFNENDPVCPDEIEYGDNDKLSANVAKLAEAERLIILTDCEGLYDSDPHSNPEAKLIHRVDKVTDEIKSIAGDSSTYVGLGGMRSKILAAEICLENNIIMNIIHKDQMHLIADLVAAKTDSEGNPVTGTEFAA